MGRRRFHRKERFALGATGNLQGKARQKSKTSMKQFSYEERKAVCDVVYHGIRDYMPLIEKPIQAMKNEDITTMLETTKAYLKKNSFFNDAAKRKLLQIAMRKLQSVLDKRIEDEKRRLNNRSQ